MVESLFQIQPVRTPADIEATANLFREYAYSLGVDLCFQDFDAELASLPGKYAPPKGELLLARDRQQGEPVGCIAVRPIPPDGCCEMKRLYVAPQGRGLGLGKALVNAIIGEAIRLGYEEMRLDTLPTMEAALALYHRAGFLPIPPYYDTPVTGTIFLARSLAT